MTTFRFRYAFLGAAMLLAACLPLGAAPNVTPQPSARAFTLFDGRGGLSVSSPWLSDRQLLHVDRVGVLRRYDLTTHADTPLRGLTRRIRANRSMVGDADISASPKGGWVKWTTENTGHWYDAKTRYYAAGIAGTKLLTWPSTNDAWTTWLPDGRRLLQIPYPQLCNIHSLPPVLMYDVRKSAQAVPVRPLPSGLGPMEVLSALSPTVIIVRKADHMVADGPERAIGEMTTSTPMRPIRRRTQEISIWDLRHNRPVKQWAPALPMEVVAAAPSPHGDRIAWVLAIPSQTRPGLPSDAEGVLWVSRMDGRNLHRIGRIDLAHRGDAFAYWAPGGKKICFGRSGALYVADVR